MSEEKERGRERERAWGWGAPDEEHGDPHQQEDARQPGCRRHQAVPATHRCKATSKREFNLPWRKASLLISTITWTRTSRLSIKICLSLPRNILVLTSPSTVDVG